MNKWIVGGIVALLAVPLHADGTLYFSEDYNSQGLYTLNTVTGAATPLGDSGVTSATVGLAESGSPAMLYGSSWANLLHINADGSGFVNVGGSGAEGLAYDPSGVLYGAINGTFFTMDPATGAVIANLDAPGHDVEGLAWAPGVVYGLAGSGSGGTPGTLLKYDIGAATWMEIGFTGISFDQVGLAYDAQEDVLYAKGNQDSYLYGISPLTAAAWQIGDTGIGAGGGLAFVGGSATIPVPGAVLLSGIGVAAVGWLRRRRTL